MVWSRHVARHAGPRRDVEPMSTDPGGAKTALDRIVIPQDALDRIAGMASPRSSLIISDEALSSETGNGTDFVVVLSGEPQGSLKIRRRGPGTEARYERPRDRLPYLALAFRRSVGRDSTFAFTRPVLVEQPARQA